MFQIVNPEVDPCKYQNIQKDEPIQKTGRFCESFFNFVHDFVHFYIILWHISQ